MIYWSPKHFWDHSDTFEIIRRLFRLFGLFSNHSHTYQIELILYRSSRHIFMIIQTFLRSPGHCPDHLQTIRRFSKSFGYFSDHLDIFWIIQICCKYPNTQRATRQKNFLIFKKKSGQLYCRAAEGFLTLRMKRFHSSYWWKPFEETFCCLTDKCNLKMNQLSKQNHFIPWVTIIGNP